MSSRKVGSSVSGLSMTNYSFLSFPIWKELLTCCMCLNLLGTLGLESVRAQASAEILPPNSGTANTTTDTAPISTTSPSSESEASVTETVRLGDDRYAQADYQGAVEAYSQALKAFKSNAYALYNRANAYRKLEEYDAAIADYTSALQIAPDNLFAYLYRGMALSATKQPEAAVADFSKVIEKDPNRALALQKRGESYLASGNAEAAIQDLQQAASLYEKDGKFSKQSQVEAQLKQARAAKSKN